MAVPLNDIVRSVTTTFLDSIGEDDPVPTPAEIEETLLNQMCAEIDAENKERSKANQLPYPKRLAFNQIADIMLRLNRICRLSPAGKNIDRDYDLLAMYVPDGDDHGIYTTSEDDFRAMARRYNYSLTTIDFKELMAALRDGAPRVETNTDANLVPVNNGVFDFDSKVLLPFSPDYVFVAKSRVNYNPTAANVVIHNDEDGTDWDVESWMEALSDDPEIVNLLWEIIGAIVRPNVPWNKAAFFYSEEGNNGKGTLCHLMRNICGSASWASVPIEEFSKDFMLEPLTRATAVIVDENNVNAYIDKVANLKAAITGDVIPINRKHKTPIYYQFRGFMVQCLNGFPRIKDKSESFYRRQLFVPFEKNFEGIERRYIKEDYLNRTEVKEYVLKRVLHMTYNVLSRPKATDLVLAEYKGFNDPIRQFWDEFADQFVWDLLPFKFLYQLYLSWFRSVQPSGSAVGLQTFNSDIVSLASKSSNWMCQDKNLLIRAATRMKAPEPLIVEYDLKDWMNPTYTGPDPDKKAMPKLSASYRGLCRTSASAQGPIGLVGSVNDTDEDLDGPTAQSI